MTAPSERPRFSRLVDRVGKLKRAQALEEKSRQRLEVELVEELQTRRADRDVILNGPTSIVFQQAAQLLSQHYSDVVLTIASESRIVPNGFVRRDPVDITLAWDFENARDMAASKQLKATVFRDTENNEIRGINVSVIRNSRLAPNDEDEMAEVVDDLIVKADQERTDPVKNSGDTYLQGSSEYREIIPLHNPFLSYEGTGE